MSNETYDVMKKIALIAAPAVVFLSTLLAIWNIPYQTEITATLAAIDTFLGAVVTVAKSNYDGKEGDD